VRRSVWVAAIGFARRRVARLAAPRNDIALVGSYRPILGTP